MTVLSGKEIFVVLNFCLRHSSFHDFFSSLFHTTRCFLNENFTLDVSFGMEIDLFLLSDLMETKTFVTNRFLSFLAVQVDTQNLALSIIDEKQEPGVTSLPNMVRQTIANHHRPIVDTADQMNTVSADADHPEPVTESVSQKTSPLHSVQIFHASALDSSPPSASAPHLNTQSTSKVSRFLQRSVGDEIPKAIARSMNQFYRPASSTAISNASETRGGGGCIDVWWIYDTGGLCMLVAHILRSSPLFRHCKVRVFSVIRSAQHIDQAKSSLEQLLRKFRIPFTDVRVLTDDVPPSDFT